MNSLPQPKKRPIVALDQYGGKWIAWNRQATRIIATGRTLDEVLRAVEETGEKSPSYEKVPKGMRFTGGMR